MQRFFFIAKYYLAIIPIIFLPSCGGFNCNINGYTTTNVNKDVKDYFCFQKGSYWIYEKKDQSRDCVYVSSYSSSWQKDRSSCSNMEEINYTLKSTINDLMPYDSLCASALNMYINFDVINSSEHMLGFLDVVVLAGDSFVGSNKKILKIDSVNLNQVHFSGELISISSSSKDKSLFFKKKIGIVGWTTTTDTVNLLKYKIQL